MAYSILTQSLRKCRMESYVNRSCFSKVFKCAMCLGGQDPERGDITRRKPLSPNQLYERGMIHPQKKQKNNNTAPEIYCFLTLVPLSIHSQITETQMQRAADEMKIYVSSDPQTRKKSIRYPDASVFTPAHSYVNSLNVDTNKAAPSELILSNTFPICPRSS